MDHKLTNREELAELTNLLTDEDIQHFSKNRIWVPAGDRRHALTNLNTDLVDFWADGVLIRWSLIILHSLSDTQVCYDEDPGDLDGEISVSAVIDRFEADAAATLAADIEAYEARTDPDWHWENQDAPSESNHPWDNNILAICRWWLLQTPYRIWRVYSEIQDWGYDQMDLHLDKWATGQAAPSCGWRSSPGCANDMQRAMEGHFNTEIDKLKAEYEAWAAKQRDTAEWDTAALPACC